MRTRQPARTKESLTSCKQIGESPLSAKGIELPDMGRATDPAIRQAAGLASDPVVNRP